MTKKYGYIKAIFISTVMLMLINGCAISGSTTAIGDKAVAIGGTSQVSIGDDVAKAALETTIAILKGITGVPTSLEKDAAIKHGVEAGLAKAGEQGHIFTPEYKKQLEQFIKENIKETIK